MNSSLSTPEQNEANEEKPEEEKIKYITKDDDVIMRFYRAMFTVQQVLPLLNSTLSPMILIWRGAALKGRFVAKCKRVRSCFKSR